MLASSSFTEESVEGIVTSSNGLVTGHLTIRLDAVLKAVQLPACIANLATSLTNVDRDNFTLYKTRQKCISTFGLWAEGGGGQK